MKKLLFTLFLIANSVQLFAQILNVSPAFPSSTDIVTITYKATEGNGALAGVSPVYMHAGLITSASTSASDWKFVKGAWGTADATVLMTNLGNNLHQITINLGTFYGYPAGTVVQKLAFVFRNAAGTIVGRNADGSDIYYDVYPSNAGLVGKFFSPTTTQLVNIGDQLNLLGKANQTAQLSIKDNGTTIASIANSTQLAHNLTVSSPGQHLLEFSVNNGTQTIIDSIYYIVNPAVNYINPPVTSKNGLNYINDSTVLIRLYAPHKQHVYVIGDFNDFTPSINYHMNLSVDSTTWWLVVSNLSPNIRYGYQFLMDNNLKVADPLSYLIADPNNDNNISASTYPNPYAYPSGKTTGFISLFETNPTVFSWQNDNYTKPDKTELMIYELLPRDFVAKHDYLTMIDTLDYLDSLGINAIELMPINEFENNESWGYNPSFHMALDKYYGTPEHFKAFVDACHARGIAVINDIALNHAFGQSPMVNMYWDAANNQPAANSPWFNAICPHEPYCWGYDLNHQVQATKDYVDHVLHYWIDEFHIDGYRLDYTKGFINSASGNSPARINILKRIADTLWAVNPSTYIILEHWADNAEEKILAEYGMLLWGNLNYEYLRAMKGSSSNFSNGVAASRSWTKNHLVTYVESHDEERGVYECLTFGNQSNAAHNVRYLPVALLRAQAAAVIMLTTPGPKMIWQFGELGYDKSINLGCRVCNKPILWNYYLDNNRRQLYDVYKATLNLRSNNEVFKNGTFQYSLSGTMKRMTYLHSTMNVVIAGNFSVQSTTSNLAFPSTGTWYEYFTGDSINVTQATASLTFQPAEYRIYTTVKQQKPTILSTVGYEELTANAFKFSVYPVPASDQLTVSIPSEELDRLSIKIIAVSGKIAREMNYKNVSNFKETISVSGMQKGTYIVLIETEKGYSSKEIIIE
jgi:1,4-alpha-glucan branching enzyme